MKCWFWYDILLLAYRDKPNIEFQQVIALMATMIRLICRKVILAMLSISVGKVLNCLLGLIVLVGVVVNLTTKVCLIQPAFGKGNKSL